MTTTPSPTSDPARHPDLAACIGGQRPYLVGIGGCGMSALARLFDASGLAVRGSDPVPSDTTTGLEAHGIRVDPAQTAELLADDADVVIASAAIRPDNPQVLEAERRGLPVLTYAEALGRTMIGRTGVCVAGTHGKSTTTAMLGCALTDAGLDPSVIVGATCQQLARGALAGLAPARERDHQEPTGFRLGAEAVPAGTLVGQPGLLIAEACEFNRSFHHHRPRHAAIANVEADHLDIYGSLDAVVEAFAGFARLIPPESEGGRLLIGHEGAHRRTITAGLSCKIETIGFAPGADWRVAFDPAARRVQLEGPGGVQAAWHTTMPGEHNAMNGAVAAALSIGLGADPVTVGRSLSAFRGLDRRMQFLGHHPVPGGTVRVYDDYGHHPTEIDATLRALRQHERPQERGGRLIVVFQPHQHSRTRFLLEEFATSFSQADVVIVPHIYFVRDSEAEKQKISSADLVDRLRKRGVRAMHLYPFEAIVEQLENLCREGDLLVVMGAGPVWKIARDYMASASKEIPVRTEHHASPYQASPFRAIAAQSDPTIQRDIGIKTWFRVGGRAERLCCPRSVEELRRALEIDPNAKVLGDGANLIVDDDGVADLVIDMRDPAFRRVEIDAATGMVGCGAGAKLPGVIGKTIAAGLAGLEGLAGIPASLGGAVVMNAGGKFGEIASVVHRVEAVTRGGELVTLGRGDIAFDYRRSGLNHLIITAVELKLTPGDRDEIEARHREVAQFKKDSQPLADRSAGCAFRNPTLDKPIPGIGQAGQRVSAGLLIDRAGCKGLRVGSAEVSVQHANFITADKDGRARDVIALMEAVARRVREVFGVTLEREVVVWSRHR